MGRPAPPAGEDTPTATLAASLTQHGSAAGTAAYMSPEQIRGEEVDARSDVFSLGATLYEMPTGKRAFPGNSMAEVAAILLEKSPTPPAEVRPEIPVSLSSAIQRALEKDKQVRYQSSAEFGAALQGAGVAATKPRRSKLLAAAIAACVAAAGSWCTANSRSKNFRDSAASRCAA